MFMINNNNNKQINKCKIPYCQVCYFDHWLHYEYQGWSKKNKQRRRINWLFRITRKKSKWWWKKIPWHFNLSPFLFNHTLCKAESLEFNSCSRISFCCSNWVAFSVLESWNVFLPDEVSPENKVARSEDILLFEFDLYMFITTFQKRRREQFFFCKLISYFRVTNETLFTLS